MASIPENYTLLKPLPGLAMVFRHGLLPLLEQAGLVQFPAAPPSNGSGLGLASGRAAAWRAELGDGGLWMIKQYHRGGLLGRIRGGSYSGISRQLQEMRVCEAAHQSGLRVPLIQCLWVQRKHRFSYRMAAATREIPGVRNLFHTLEDRLDAEGRLLLLAAAAGEIRKLHDAGIKHPDLNLGNILVTGTAEAPEIHLIDFDRAALLGRPLNRKERYSALTRMYRSLAKLSRPEEQPLAAAEKEHFIARYWHDAPGPHMALRRRCRRELALHRLWWRLNPPRTGG